MASGQTSAAVQRIWTGVPNTKGEARPRRTGIDEDLAWYLECGDSVVGRRGTLAGIVAALELGGHPGGVPNTDLYTDRQIGWGRNGNAYGEVERHRWLESAFLALSHESQRVLLARYSPPPAEFRSDEGYGARDKFVDGAHPVGPRPIQPIGKKGKPVKAKQYAAQLDRWQRRADRIASEAKRTSVESQLGEFASLAIHLCDDPGKLLAACRDPKKGNLDLRQEALRVAREANDKAHAEWVESKAGADPMRAPEERARRAPIVAALVVDL